MVRAEGSRSRGRGGSNTAVYWMDVSDAGYYIFNEKEKKVAKWGTPKKKFKKTFDINLNFKIVRFVSQLTMFETKLFDKSLIENYGFITILCK